MAEDNSDAHDHNADIKHKGMQNLDPRLKLAALVLAFLFPLFMVAEIVQSQCHPEGIAAFITAMGDWFTSSC